MSRRLVLFAAAICQAFRLLILNATIHETSLSSAYLDEKANAYRTRLTRNILSRITRQLGLSRSHVCEVANGHRRSQIVEAALAAEYARIESEVQQYISAPHGSERTPEIFAQRSKRSRQIWAEPGKRQQIISSMRSTLCRRNSEIAAELAAKNGGRA